MSSAMLANRLKQLERAGILARSPGKTSTKTDYALTDAGHALFPILDQMGIWAQDWLRRDIVAEENLDPDVLFWELRQLSILRKTHPKRRRVASFLLSGVPAKKQRYWIVFEPNDTEICVKDPGHDVDIFVSAHIRALVEVWLGHVSLEAAVDQNSVTLNGSTSEIKAFSSWFMLSHFSKVGLETTPKI